MQCLLQGSNQKENSKPALLPVDVEENLHMLSQLSLVVHLWFYSLHSMLHLPVWHPFPRDHMSIKLLLSVRQ